VALASLLCGYVDPALAIQPKNEALCSTGFFENSWQYKCTELGDIEDEGKATGLSRVQETAADSLFDKLQQFSNDSDLSEKSQSFQKSSAEGGSNKMDKIR